MGLVPLACPQGGTLEFRVNMAGQLKKSVRTGSTHIISDCLLCSEFLHLIEARSAVDYFASVKGGTPSAIPHF